MVEAGAIEPTIRDRWVPLTTAVILITLVGLSISLMIPLLALEMERMGVSSSMAGFNTATAGLGNIAVVPFIPALASRHGTQRVIFFTIVVLCITILAFKALPDIVIWFPLRFVLGACLGALFTLSEFWIASAAPPSKRGLVMGIYATALSIGFALGPLILALIGTIGWLPYAIAAGICLLGIATVLASPSAAPTLSSKHNTNVFALVLAAPAATLAALVFGASETASITHLPVIGVRAGYTEELAAIMVSILAAGNIVSQIPFGYLSDRMDRRLLLLIIAVFSFALLIGFGLALDYFWLAAILLFCFGGVVGALYTVGLAHLGARYSGNDLADANAAFVILYSVGLTLGPPFVGGGIDLFGSIGFSFATGAIIAAYALLVLYRLVKH
jgi:MFS family permease